MSFYTTTRTKFYISSFELIIIAQIFVFCGIVSFSYPPSPVFSLQKQVSVMSMNLSAKLDELQRGPDRQIETTVALCEIRTQLQELTKSVESCQSEVSEVRNTEFVCHPFLTHIL